MLNNKCPSFKHINASLQSNRAPVVANRITLKENNLSFIQDILKEYDLSFIQNQNTDNDAIPFSDGLKTNIQIYLHVG